MFSRKITTGVVLLLTAFTALATAVPGALAAVPSQTAPVAPPSPAKDAPLYVDNRSDAVTLLQAYFNAINRQEYARAYSYWETNSQVGGFPQFVAGFATTQSVALTTGAVGGDAGAGQRYFIVPVVLQSTTSGGNQTYVGCYVLHLAAPAIQAAPPFQPLGIASAHILQVPSGADPAALQAQGCTAAGWPGAGLVTLAATPGAPESGASFYIDDRNGPLEVLQSLFNAINRQEYARAYGYWETSAQLAPFATFQQGYANTQSVQWSYGPVTSDAGAGQFYYSVPVTLQAQTTGGPQTFVGCYILHLANPGIQAAPPYQPLSIHSGNLSQVANNANTAALMQQACQSVPAPFSPPIHVSFARGATSATVAGSLAAGGAQEYQLWAGERQLMWVDLASSSSNDYLEIYGRESGQLLARTDVGTTHWQGLLPATDLYGVRVISSGTPLSFTLQVTIPRRITFAPGATSATVPGMLASRSINSYVLHALAGQTLTAKLFAPMGTWLEIVGVTDGQPLVLASARSTYWTGQLPAAQDYVVRVVSTGLGTTFSLAVTVQ